MMNAKEELLQHIKGCPSKVKAAQVIFGGWNSRSVAELIQNHTDDQFDEFLSKLDFGYDAGYGSQEIHGVIWYTNGTWSHRGEYDGSEWW